MSKLYNVYRIPTDGSEASAVRVCLAEELREEYPSVNLSALDKISIGGTLSPRLPEGGRYWGLTVVRVT